MPIDYKFTGQRGDATGLTYMNARYYDPQLGAFISPDSLMPDPTGLADYNRYLYAQGNPMRYTDPSGHQEFEGVCTYCQDEEGSGAPERGDGSAFHLSGVDSRALKAEASAEAARQANAANNGGFFSKLGGFFKWLIGSEEENVETQATNQPKTVSTPIAHDSKESVTSNSPTDHIVLGLANYGLEDTAEKVGGRTLLQDSNWMSTLQNAITNPGTEFTVALDGLSGSSPYSKVIGAVQTGIGPNPTPTNWELAQLYIANRLQDVNFVLNGQSIENPFK